MKTSASGWLTMGIFWTSYALCQVMMSGIGLMLPNIGSEMSLSSAQAGALGAIGWILAAFATVPISAWITRFDPKRTVSIALSALVLIHLAHAWSPGYPFLLAARGIGLLVILSIPSVIVLLQKQWFPPEKMGTVKGIETGMASLGNMAAMAIIPFIMRGLGGWRATYALTGVLLLPVVMLWALFAREKQTAENPAKIEKRAIETSPIRAILRHREFVLLGIGSAGASIAYVSIMVFWPTYATQEQGLSLATAGLILSIAAMGGLGGSFLAGLLSDKIGLRKPIPLASGLLLPVGYFAMLNINAVPALAILAFFTGFCTCIYIPAILAMAFELKGIEPRETAVGIGFIMAITNLGAALGSQLSGIMIDRLGLYPALATLSLSPLALSMCMLWCAETGKRVLAKRPLGATAAGDSQA